MGVDLKLLPVDSEGVSFSHQVISTVRDSERDERIQALNPSIYEKPLSCYLATGPDGEARYGGETEDKYGNPLTWLWASQLRGVGLGATAEAFVGALPDRTRVVLFWS